MSEAETKNGYVVFGGRAYPREAVVFVSLVILLLIFLGLTAFVARSYHKKVHVLADNWFAQGEAESQDGRSANALTDYRNALAFTPGNPKFQFHLAQALAATGRAEEARSYLMNLLSESPGSGEVNLELARVAASQKHTLEAVRFYQSAIYGEWTKNPINTRWNVRRELCEFLLDHNAATQAEPEVIALADNTPSDDVPQLKTAATLLLRAQLWTRALDEFHTVLESSRHDPDALAGAGAAAFNLAQYPRALGYFDRLSRDRREDPNVSAMADTARRILASDPFLIGISLKEKALRTSRALTEAQSRVTQCSQEKGQAVTASPASTSLQQLFATSRQMEPDWTVRNLERHPERVVSVMDLAFQMEDAAAQSCGQPQGQDRALWLLGRNRGGAQ